MNQSIQNTATVKDLVINTYTVIDEPGLQKILWDEYKKAFLKVNIHFGYFQSLHKKDFIEALTDPDFFKFIQYKGSELSGMTILSNNPEKLGRWLSIPCMERHYPEFLEQKRIFYVVTIFVKEKFRGDQNTFLCVAKACFNLIKQYTNGGKGVVVNDYAIMSDYELEKVLDSVPGRFWPARMIKVLGKGLENHKGLGLQSYHSYIVDTSVDLEDYWRSITK